MMVIVMSSVSVALTSVAEQVRVSLVGVSVWRSTGSLTVIAPVEAPMANGLAVAVPVGVAGGDGPEARRRRSWRR